MADLGEPTSYLALKEGTNVVSADGVEVGKVQHVLADPEEDVFDGLVIDSRLGPGGLRFCDAPQVARICEHEVRLTIDAGAAERLPEPSENPAVMEAGPDDLDDPGLAGKLRRAWDKISGNY